MNPLVKLSIRAFSYSRDCLKAVIDFEIRLPILQAFSLFFYGPLEIGLFFLYVMYSHLQVVKLYRNSVDTPFVIALNLEGSLVPFFNIGKLASTYN